MDCHAPMFDFYFWCVGPAFNCCLLFNIAFCNCHVGNSWPTRNSSSLQAVHRFVQKHLQTKRARCSPRKRLPPRCQHCVGRSAHKGWPVPKQHRISFHLRSDPWRLIISDGSSSSSWPHCWHKTRVLERVAHTNALSSFLEPEVLLPKSSP